MKEKQLRQTDPNVHEEEEIAEVQKNAVPINFDLSPYYTDDMVRFQSYYSRCVCPSARVNACDGIGQYGSVLLDLPESFDIIGSHHAGVEVFVRNMADAAAASNSAARWLFPNIGMIPHGRTEREGGEFVFGGVKLRAKRALIFFNPPQKNFYPRGEFFFLGGGGNLIM